MHIHEKKQAEDDGSTDGANLDDGWSGSHADQRHEDLHGKY